MFKTFVYAITAIALLINASGCVFLLVGAVGAIGTATWLEGKLSQDFNVPFDRMIAGVKKGLASLKLEVAKETRKETVCQLISNYYDGRMIWVDIHRISDNLSQVEVRVGAMGDQYEARKIMGKIRHYAH
jgi:hypothetical protein